MAERRWSWHGLLSRVLAGGTVGCTALLAEELVRIPPWQPLWKSDERWHMVLLVAEYGLPAAFVLGALVGLAWRPARAFRLSLGGMVVCCLAVAHIALALRPVVARVSLSGRPPLYEAVPDTMAALFGLAALALVSVGAVRYLGTRLRQRARRTPTEPG